MTGTTATLTVKASGSSDREYDVTASGGDLAGLNDTVTLSFAQGQDIEDLVGNALTSATPSGTDGSSYAVDNAAPTVSSIVRRTPFSVADRRGQRDLAGDVLRGRER